MSFARLFSTGCLLVALTLPLAASAAVADYLDYELPDSSLDSNLRIKENGKTYTREAYQDAQTRAEITTTQGRDGDRSLMVTHLSNSGTDKDRMEWNWHNWNPGSTYWSGFSFRFDPAMEAPVASSGDCLMHQWKNQQAGYTASLMLLNKTAKTDPLELRVKLGYGPTESQRAYHFLDPGYIFARGEWYDVVVNYKITCSGTNDSFFKVWINGQLVIDFTGNIGIVERASTTGQHKFGLYRGQQQRWMRISHDAMRRGANYAEVDPASYDPAGGEMTKVPVADAFVRGGSTYSSTSFGTATSLEVKGSYNESFARRSFLRFNLAGTDTEASSAELSLVATSVQSEVTPTSPAAVKVYAVDNDSWVESGTGGITWHNKPALGVLLGTINVTGTGEYSLALTAHVDAVLGGDQVLSLALAQDSTVDRLVIFGSREATLSSQPLLSYTPASGGAVEIIIDNNSPAVAKSSGWTSSAQNAQRYGTDYLHDGDSRGNPVRWITWTPDFPSAGNYEVFVWHPASSAYASNATYVVEHLGGRFTTSINQRTNGGTWRSLGIFGFSAGQDATKYVGLKNSSDAGVGADGYVVADAVRLVKQ